MLKTLTLTGLLGILLTTGCTWVKPTPGGEKVRVLDADEVSTCKALGTTTVSLVDKIAGISRNPQKVEKELQTLARNSASRIGGDTVVPISQVSAGQQRFAIYKCVGATQ
ncbi:MAG TPA: DUF4156 domain-containing protein [Gammaproteobacteria bacterium]|nr:DUF4156 domain-containing protein [Gammaproteobacteria bacterium]